VQYANLENPGPWDVAVVCHLTISLMFQKDIDSAVKRVGACLRGAQMAGNPQLLATAHQTNVWVLEAAGRREEAAESIRYLLQHAPEDPSLYVQKAQLDTQQGERVASLESWKHALLLFEGRKDLSNAASAHLAIADSLSVAKKDGDDEQRMHLEAALGLYRDLNDAAGQVRACILLAEFFGKKKDTSHARAFFDTALKLSHQARMPNLEANVLSQIGQLYRPAEPVKALDYYRRAESIYHNQNDTVDEAFQLQNESWTLDDLKRPEEALQTALKGKLLADKSGSWLARYWVRRLLGSLYANRGEYENGLTVVREARAISDSANQPLYSAWAASSLAIGFVTIGDWEEARAQIDFALPILKNFKDVDDEFAAYSQLMDIYGARESELKDLTKRSSITIPHINW